LKKTLKLQQNQVNYKNKNKTLSNLTYTQLAAFRSLKNDRNFIIKPTDKNLGPAIMETNAYTL